VRDKARVAVDYVWRRDKGPGTWRALLMITTVGVCRLATVGSGFVKLYCGGVCCLQSAKRMWLRWDDLEPLGFDVVSSRCCVLLGVTAGKWRS
jgi:hypothetical protein